MKTKTLTLALSLILSVSVSAWAQKKTMLMILPSENWCIQHGYTSVYDNQGVTESIPDYQQAFQNSKELNDVIANIGELMIKMGYSLKDAAMELRNISNRTAEDNVTFSKTTGAQLSESPLDVLKRRAKADIIIQIGWNVSRITGGRMVKFSIEAFDAYTSKRIATSSGSYDASVKTISDALPEAINKQLKPFDKQLDTFYSNMKENGRETVLTIRTWENWDMDLETEFNGDELLNHIQQWLHENTVKGQFNLTDATDDMAQFEQVMIPLKDTAGKDLDARGFTRQLQKYISSRFNITSKLMMRGLGEAILVLGEK